RHVHARRLRREGSAAAGRPGVGRRRSSRRWCSLNHFQRKRGELCCEDVPLAELAEEVGTPAYVYSQATLLRHARVFRSALRGLDALACFAVKSSPNLAILRLL